MRENTPEIIVITGIQPWDIGIGSNCKNIALELSKNHKVMYVNPPLDLKYFLFPKKSTNLQGLNNRKDMRSGIAHNVTEINKNLNVVTPTFFNRSINKLPKSVFDIFNVWTNKKLAKTIRLNLKKLGWDGSFGLLSDSDMFRSLYLKRELAPSYFAYYMRDNLMCVPFWQKHGPRYEHRIAKEADICFANSPYLRDILKQWNPNSHYIGQGCETEEFANCSTGESRLENLGGPIVGYVGFLTSSRLNLSLLERLCSERPDLKFALVGPEDADFMASKLHQLPNVYFYGKQDPDSLPEWIYGFDVCMNPQIVNDLTIGNYPRKIDEYLAAGKPTIATQTPTMEIFKDYVYLGEVWEDYSINIDRSLLENSDQVILDRKAFARNHSWKNSVDQMTQIIAQYASRN